MKRQKQPVEKGVYTMATDNKSLLYAILLGIGVGIALPIVFYFLSLHADAKEKEYLEKGVLTDCYVQTVVNVNSRQQVFVVYNDENGKQVKASAILNKRVVAGETVQAYVLASRPGEVFYPADSLWKWVFFGIICVAAIASWIPLIVVIRGRKMEKLSARFREQMRAMNSKDRQDFADDMIYRG